VKVKLIEQVGFLQLQKFFNSLGNKGLCHESRKQIKQLISQFYKNYAIKKAYAEKTQLTVLISVQLRGQLMMNTKLLIL